MSTLTEDERAPLLELLKGYITCALWSTNDNSDEQGGDPLDDNYSKDDLAPETFQRMLKDCAKFIQDNQSDIAAALAHYKNVPNAVEAFQHVGHDFWLTRNHHGAGFWDGDLPDDLGDRLTEAAHKFGSCDIYVGDDGKIYAQ